MKVSFTLNQRLVEIDVSMDANLLEVLRNQLGMTGSKHACDSGTCGACAVLVDGKLVNSCQLPIQQVAGCNVLTIEGVSGPNGEPNDLQLALLDHGATQCGYCIPGMVMAGEALLARNPSPTHEEIRQTISSNLCRCTGYQQIIDAIDETATRRAQKRTYPFPSPWMQGIYSKRNLHFVGKPSHAVDGLEKVTGRAKYVGDIHLPGMLYARVLRSPIPHARIVQLNTAPALQVPGVVAAITCDDFVDHGNLGWPVKDAYVLAYRKVRYVGEGIAAVAAESEAEAINGIQAIQYELEELPAIFDPARSLEPDAVLIPEQSPTGQGNLTNSHLVRNGEPDSILAECAEVLDETYFMAHQEHAYLETEGALAIPDPDGGVTVYANDQSPFINRDNLVLVLGLLPEKVRVIQPPVGGSFGGKDDIGYQTSAQAARLALRTGRPVRMILSRSESFLASYKREAMRIRAILGANDQGQLRAAKIEILADSGAYASMTPLASWRATVHAAGAYRYEAVHVDTHAVYTNNGYSGAFRGFGNTEAVAAIEQAIDELAYRLERDPIDFRLQNCLRRGDRAMTGNRIDHAIGLVDCLEWVRENSGWDQKRSQYAHQAAVKNIRNGIGVACYFHGSSLGGEGADYATTTLKIEDDYTITMTSGLTDYGQGSRTVFTLLAAEGLGVSPERIHMLRPDTQTSVESGPTVASRCSMVGGNATRVASLKLNEQLLLAAAERIGCQPVQIHRGPQGEYIGPNEEPLMFEQVVDHAREMGLVLSVHGHWRMPEFEWDFQSGQGMPYYAYTFGAQVAEVEVNMQNGVTKVTGMWAAHDGGKIIFPQGALGQMFGGIAQGIGYALFEEMLYHKGYPQSIDYDDYHIPRALDIPPISAKFIETNFPEGPYGAKNIAEPTMVATAPAIVNAIFQATGIRRRMIPLTPNQLCMGQSMVNPDDVKERCLRVINQ
jgi:xanthine dehydrogenase molybdenum-binding subunit